MGRGGCGWWHIGSPAALASAKAGARTLAIEYMDELGGVGTAGMISTYWYGFRNGYTAEVDKALGTKESWNQIQKSEWLRQQILKKWRRALVCQLWVRHCYEGQSSRRCSCGDSFWPWDRFGRRGCRWHGQRRYCRSCQCKYALQHFKTRRFIRTDIQLCT